MTRKTRTALYLSGALLTVIAALALITAGNLGGLILVLTFAATFALVGVAAGNQKPALWSRPQQ